MQNNLLKVLSTKNSRNWPLKNEYGVIVIFLSFLVSCSWIQSSLNKESAQVLGGEKAALNLGLQEMLIPIFYRRGSVWGAGTAVVPFKSPTAWVLHAWSPNVRPDRRTGIPCKMRKNANTRSCFLLIHQENCFSYTCSGLFFTHRRGHISRNIITKK